MAFISICSFNYFSIGAKKCVIKAHMLLAQYSCLSWGLCGRCLQSLKLIHSSVDVVILFEIRMSSLPVGPWSRSLMMTISLPDCHERYSQRAKYCMHYLAQERLSPSYLQLQNHSPQWRRFPCSPLYFSQDSCDMCWMETDTWTGKHVIEKLKSVIRKLAW